MTTNPLCPQCQVVLNDNIIVDGLTCPSCEYEWDGTLDLNTSITPQETEKKEWNYIQ